MNVLETLIKPSQRWTLIMLNSQGRCLKERRRGKVDIDTKKQAISIMDTGRMTRGMDMESCTSVMM